MNSRSLSWRSPILFIALGSSLGAQEFDGITDTPPRIFNIPRVWIGGGSFEYRERNFETAPGLSSRYREPLIGGGVGWDIVLNGQHAITFDFEVLGTTSGEERWRESGVLLQENDLRVHRFSLSAGYLWSTWDRSVPPAELPPKDRTLRFGIGGAPFYRHQAFRRTDFVDTTEDPPLLLGGTVDENFDMFGAELILNFEAGPRHIAAAFVRGRSGIGYVAVRNNGIGFGIDSDDSRMDTFGVHGQVEAGIVSQPAPHVELRLGYRYLRQEVFGAREEILGFDPLLGPVIVTIELPDNATEAHMVFLEAAFPF